MLHKTQVGRDASSTLDFEDLVRSFIGVPNGSEQEALRKAAFKAGIGKRITCHTFRHCFAAHLLEAVYDIRTLQELLGRKNVETTTIYFRVLSDI